MKRFFWIIALFCVFYGCSNPPITGNDVLGARDFVIDSYKIKEGKFSILEIEGKPIEDLNPAFLEDQEEKLADGDILEVSLYHPMRPDIAPYVHEIGKKIGYKIENGYLILPDLPPLKVGGVTLEQVREKIQNAYKIQIPDVEVFVTYKKRKEYFVQLIGLIHQSQVPIKANTRLFDVLSGAKVPNQANYFKSYVVRDEKAIPVDMYKLVIEGDMSQNIVMKNGDKIYVADQNASAILVMGEVARQGIIPLSTPSLPLQEALAKSGGMLFTGNRAFIQVIRGSLIKPKIYTLNWRHIVRLPSDSMLLIPGDIVYVAATPIAEWNRFINQLLPSFTIYELFAKGIKGVIIQDGATN